MKTLRSSWNSDRVAACYVNRPRTTPKKRETRMYTEYRGKNLKVKTYRNAIRYAASYNSDIASAVYSSGELTVRLIDGSIYTYALDNEKFVQTSIHGKVQAPAAVIPAARISRAA